MRLLNLINYFAQVSEVMNRRDNSYTSEDINNYNEQLASMTEDCPFEVREISNNNESSFCLA